MAKKKTDVAPETPEIETGVAGVAGSTGEVAEKPAAKQKGTSVTVKYRDGAGNVTERVFSQEVHGDNFAALAEEFKATNAKQCEGLNG